MAMTVKVASDTPELIEFDVDQVTASGFQVSYSFKGAPDGKEYPITGSATVYSYTEQPGVAHETSATPTAPSPKATSPSAQLQGGYLAIHHHQSRRNRGQAEAGLRPRGLKAAPVSQFGEAPAWREESSWVPGL